MEQQETPWLVAKIMSVWAAVGVTSWSEAASFMAFIYTFCLFTRWIYVHGIKPMLIKRGLMKPETALEKARDNDDPLPL